MVQEKNKKLRVLIVDDDATVAVALGARVGSEQDKGALSELTERLRKGECFRAVSMPIFKLRNEEVVGYEILSRGPAGAFEMPDDLAILQEQERLISGLNPPHPIIFRSNHASNALALAGNLPKDKEKLLLQLREAMAGIRPLRPHYLRGL